MMKCASERGGSWIGLSRFSSRMAAFSSSISTPDSDMPRMLASACVATGAGRLQPGIIGIAATTLAASVVRQNRRLSTIISPIKLFIVSLADHSRSGISTSAAFSLAVGLVEVGSRSIRLLALIDWIPTAITGPMAK